MFTNSWEVRLPSGSPLPGAAEKLWVILSKSQTIFLSGIYFFRISNNISWLIFSKNFLISHFRIQQVLVLFLLTLRAKFRNLFSALCVPFPIWQEKESAMKVQSKNG